MRILLLAFMDGVHFDLFADTIGPHRIALNTIAPTIDHRGGDGAN
jgi:hypothetical protein